MKKLRANNGSTPNLITNLDDAVNVTVVYTHRFFGNDHTIDCTVSEWNKTQLALFADGKRMRMMKTYNTDEAKYFV